MNAKQKRFAEEYLIDLNGAQAAIRAGYSPKTADRIAYQLLRNLEIQNYVRNAMEKQSERTEITADIVLDELIKIARSDASDSTGAELKYAGKIKALELLGKHLGLFDAKQEPDNVIRVVFDGGEGFAD